MSLQLVRLHPLLTVFLEGTLARRCQDHLCYCGSSGLHCHPQNTPSLFLRRAHLGNRYCSDQPPSWEVTPNWLASRVDLNLGFACPTTVVWNTKQRISQLTVHNSFKDFTRWTCLVFLLFYLWIYNYKHRLWYWWVSLWHFHVACTLYWPQLTRPMLFLVSVFRLPPLPRPLTLP